MCRNVGPKGFEGYQNPSNGEVDYSFGNGGWRWRGAPAFDRHPSVSEPTTPEDRQQVALALLEKGTLFVHLDPRIDGVIVPPSYASEPQLVLQVGLHMPVPIPDLRVDDDGISGTLSFNRRPYGCVVPWAAVFALAGDDGRGMVWPEAMPQEIAAEIEREAGRAPPVAPSEPQPDNVVDLGAERQTDKPRRTPRAGPKRSRPLPPYLKIVK